MKNILIGKGLLLAGVALITFGFFGGVAHQVPELTPYFAAGGAGIVAISAGLLAGAIPLDS